jgi:hypothetical protein
MHKSSSTSQLWHIINKSWDLKKKMEDGRLFQRLNYLRRLHHVACLPTLLKFPCREPSLEEGSAHREFDSDLGIDWSPYEIHSLNNSFFLFFVCLHVWVVFWLEFVVWFVHFHFIHIRLKILYYVIFFNVQGFWIIFFSIYRFYWFREKTIRYMFSLQYTKFHYYF